MPSIVIGKVKGDKGDTGFSPLVELIKEEGNLTITITDSEGTKSETISTGEPVQVDWETTDTALLSYIKNKPEIPSKTSQLTNDSNFVVKTGEPVTMNDMFYK